MEKRNFYFQRANGTFLCLGSSLTEQEALRAMHEFMENHDYRSYYTRSWNDENGTWYDVGSHTEFFLWGWRAE